MSIPITPETKLGALLDAYPGIEDALIAWVPEFRKLKNPILRRTVAKVATIEQAAKIGGVSVRDMVIKLRKAAGQDVDEPVGEGAAASDAAPAAAAPAWFDPKRIRETIDADCLLDAGEHPIGKVRRHAAALQPGDIFQLKSSFRPAPLIENL